ncbi:NtaA/DmoA family FMN-dependent monooxygenase [Kibdelosporangium phytohabitans]|uniref:F420-dependent methylene-tetrahydromethanopterin reductase n=1 Tax=Kibdelosporangium phytohabitans TaxID=860235 RepID=A0A0N9I642_9PSEU|nr:NtaA/DmoA family FMN-dependent monooxygenase [Kibdelosporangium phytohabitans]ALG09910.1 F420-dependent methylene-tetrahydromethanopterin reductase [Kibdelosporangium phytohabitans]MBE1468685.1 FMN-dependent oxidoreductase (nitrilotriacetate monooxygenase family) [Kibdelosporangium phytohabitans]
MSQQPEDPDAQVHLGVFYTGVGPQFIWADESNAPHTEIETYVSVARTLERGLFDAFFLGEGLRVRENRGRIHSLDVAGRPDAITQLSALAAATDRIGLVVTQNTTYNFPGDLARRLSTLDILSGGRAGWNIVTTDNAWTGANFRRGGWLAHERRYERANQFVEAAKAIWDSWDDDAVTESAEAKTWARPGAIRSVERHTDLVDLTVTPTLPRSPQGRPVLFQAGDSPGGRDLAARHADVVFSANTEHTKALAYADDLRARLKAYGRPANAIRILPGASVVLGDTPSEAQERAEWVRAQQINPQRAIAFLEQYWGRDLSHYDPHGPLPDVEPVDGELDPSRGTISIEHRTGKLERIQGWRDLAATEQLSIHQLVLRVQPRERVFVGTPSRIADEWVRYVRTRAVDGFNISPHLVPSSLDDIVDKLVPELQERGAYRTAYEGTTLREHLALPPEARGA